MQEEIIIKFEKLKIVFCCKCGKNLGIYKVNINDFIWCEECYLIKEKIFISGI